MFRVVDLRKADDPRDVIHRAVHLLAEGEVVALPTETVYLLAAHALRPEGVEKLRAAVAGLVSDPPVLGIKGPHEALDYVPRMSALARRLTRRCWPGPVTLALESSDDAALLASLPAEARRAVVREGELRLRAPAHEVVQDILRLMPAPLVLSGEHWKEASPPHTAQVLDERLGERAALVIDSGPSRYGEPASVVRVSDHHWSLVEPGVVSETVLRRLASEVVLFVCTGNTCRSPMAEGLFRKLLADKLDCSEDELPDRGFVVASAGLSAAAGMPASREAVDLLAHQGIDLTTHESQPLTDRLLEQADRIYTMTQAHRDSILAARPDLADRVYLLASDGLDICDPIGGGPEDYERCGREIGHHVRTLLAHIDQPERQTRTS